MPDDLRWSWCNNKRKKVKSLTHVQLFATTWTLPGSFVHGIFQARILEWVAISFSRNAIIIKCIINAMRLNHSKTIPLLYPTAPCSLWENCLPRNWSLVPKRLGTAVLGHQGLWLQYIWGDKIQPIPESSTGFVFWTRVVITSSWSDLGLGAGEVLHFFVSFLSAGISQPTSCSLLSA